MTEPLHEPAPGVTVRYWAAAREAAGVDSEVVRPDGALEVGTVLAAASAAHPGLARVVEVSSILLDGRVVAPDRALAAGDVLEVLPPFAGG